MDLCLPESYFMTELRGFPLFGGGLGHRKFFLPLRRSTDLIRRVKFLVLGCLKLNARRRKHVYS